MSQRLIAVFHRLKISLIRGSSGPVAKSYLTWLWSRCAGRSQGPTLGTTSNVLAESV